jgi:hypothetical protein
MMEVGTMIAIFRLKTSAPHTWPQYVKATVISAAAITVILSYAAIIGALLFALLMVIAR